MVSDKGSIDAQEAPGQAWRTGDLRLSRFHDLQRGAGCPVPVVQRPELDDRFHLLLAFLRPDGIGSLYEQHDPLADIQAVNLIDQPLSDVGFFLAATWPRVFNPDGSLTSFALTFPSD